MAVRLTNYSLQCSIKSLAQKHTKPYTTPIHMKRVITAILMIILALAAIIVASVLQEPIGAIGFWILLSFGIIFILGGIFELFFALHRRRRVKKGQRPLDEQDGPEYRKKRNYLSVPEKAFYDLLVNMLPTELFAVFPQAALVSVVEKVTHTSYRNELFRIIDFVVTDIETTEPLLLIELNDASHLRAEVVARDKKVQTICHKARIPIVAFTLQEAQDPKHVEAVLRRYL